MKASIAIAAAFLAGCASNKPSDYEQWAALPPPESWRVGSTWTIVVVDDKQQLMESMIVSLTDKSAESCTSGNWRRVEILSQHPEPRSQVLGMPAYSLVGSAFTMSFTANFCDIDNELRGKLTEAGVSGVYYAGGPSGGKYVGHFYGVQVDDSPSKPLQPIASKRAPAER
jgi:hypothetical protein